MAIRSRVHQALLEIRKWDSHCSCPMSLLELMMTKRQSFVEADKSWQFQNEAEDSTGQCQ